MLVKSVPKVVLICHEDDPIDREGLFRWLAHSMQLAGVVLIRNKPANLLQKIKREIRRVGFFRFLDVVAYRIYYRLFHAAADAAWKKSVLAALREKYPDRENHVPAMLTEHPDAAPVRHFLQRIQPDMVIARCKFILSPRTFNIPRFGTYVLHPGICPEYRNAHGCFWALVNRDLSRVGMTLLRVNEGVDTGPVYLQATYDFDEVHESPVIIQYRVVIENLDVIANTLISVFHGDCKQVSIGSRRSAVWGQPWLSSYWKWKMQANRATRRKVAH